MAFKNLSIFFLAVALGCLQNTLALPAPDTPVTVGGAAGSTPPGSSGSGVILADNPLGAAGKDAGTGAGAGKDAGAGVGAGKDAGAGKEGGAGKTGSGKEGGAKSKTAGLTQAELVEACAPLINPSKGSSPPAGPPGGQGGAGVAPGAVGGKGALPAPVPAQSNDPKKDAVKESKDGKGGKGGAGKDKGGAASTLSGSAVSSAALPIILSISVGWLFG